MAQFGRNSNGDTIQAFPINNETREILAATDVSCTNLDTVRSMTQNTITVVMRTGSDVVIVAEIGEDFAFTQDCISFSATGTVRVA